MGRRSKAKRSSLQQLGATLTASGHPASRPTVARLLRKLGYSPKANARRKEARRFSRAAKRAVPANWGATRAVHRRRADYQRGHEKMELIGNFKNAGRK